MKRLLRGDMTLLAALLVALIVVAVRVAQPEAEPRTESRPHYTVRSARPSGLRAYGELLRRRGYPIESLKQGPRDWPRRAAAVITAPPYESFGSGTRWSKPDAERALDWVEAGGALLVLCDEATELTEALEIVFAAGDGPEGAGALAQPLTVLGKVERLSVPAGERFDEPTADRLPLARVDGAPIAVAWTLGKGTVVALACPKLASNQRLGEADNAPFVAGAIDWLAAGRPGPVFFDEFHQGDQESANAWDLIGRPGQSAAWQIVAVGLLWVHAASLRFGAPRSARLRSRTTGDYVQAVADLYRSVGAADAARVQLREGFVADLRRRADLHEGADASEAAERACRASGAPERTRDLQALLERLDTPLEGRTGQRERRLLALAREIDGYRKELGLRD
jgi:hypothetical protein